MITDTSVRTVIDQLELAWNSADGEAYGAPYAEDAEFVTVQGMRISGRHAIAAGLLDEIEVQIVPVLLGDGRPMFELLGLDLDPPLELERIRVLEGDGGVTHLRYRVLRSSSS